MKKILDFLSTKLGMAVFKLVISASAIFVISLLSKAIDGQAMSFLEVMLFAYIVSIHSEIMRNK